MKVKLTVEVELTHVSGKFMSKEEAAEKLVDELQNSDPGSITSDDDAEYTVDSFEVSPA